jgi:hypothetical protein
MDGQVDGDRVVAAAQVLHERMPRRDGARGRDTFEPAHRPQPRLEPAVISLDHVVNRYEDLGVAGSAGRSRLAWGCWSAYGASVRDGGAGSEAGWAGRCYALG